MQEAVSEVLHIRAHAIDGMGRTMTASFVMHLLLLGAIVGSSQFWRHAPAKPTPMVVTLNPGAVGPKTGGITPLGGRPVEQAVPVPKHPEPILPVSPKKDLTPDPKKAPVTKAVTPPKPTPITPLTYAQQKPATGAVVTPGTAHAETGVRGVGTGLSTGGGAKSNVSLDDIRLSDFCCPDYIATIEEEIHDHATLDQGVQGEVIVAFTIQKDGRFTFTGTGIETPSPVFQLNQEAQRALSKTQQQGFPPLPREFTGDHLTVHLKIIFGTTL